MHKTFVNRLLGNPQRARGAGRFGFVGGLASIAALLVMTPAPRLMADNVVAPATTNASLAAATPSAAVVPAAVSAPAAAPAAPAAAPVDSSAPTSGVFKRVEIYGTMITSTSTTVTLPPAPGAKPGAKKVTEKRAQTATILSLVVTSSDPLPVGKKGVLLRKVEKPGDLAATQWVKVADLTLKKIDPTGKMTFDVNAEDRDVLIQGKKEDHFKKGTKIKVQIDVQVE